MMVPHDDETTPSTVDGPPGGIPEGKAVEEALRMFREGKHPRVDAPEEKGENND